MAKISPFIKTKNGKPVVNSEGKTLIYLRVSHGGNFQIFSSGAFIPSDAFQKDPDDPINRKFKGKNAALTTYKTKKANLEESIRRCQLKEIEPTPGNVKKELAIIEGVRLKLSAIEEPDFFESFDDFIRERETTKAPGTIRQYRSVKLKVMEFAKHAKRKPTFENVNSDFFNEWIDYMVKNMEYSNNTFDHKLKTLKTFLKWAKVKGYKVNTDFENVPRYRELNEIIYLTETEIKTLVDFIPPKERNGLIPVRDLFIFQCLTGLRISDLQRVGKEHIQGSVLKMKAHKNKKSIRLPLLPQAYGILMKYDFQLPQFSEQYYRRAIKDLCQMAGIDSLVENVVYKGGKKIYTKVPKWEKVSSHTAVKTFISLCVERGVPPKSVAIMTGKSVKILMDHYYNMEPETIDKQMDVAFSGF